MLVIQTQKDHKKARGIRELEIADYMCACRTEKEGKQETLPQWKNDTYVCLNSGTITYLQAVNYSII